MVHSKQKPNVKKEKTPPLNEIDSSKARKGKEDKKKVLPATERETDV